MISEKPTFAQKRIDIIHSILFPSKKVSLKPLEEKSISEWDYKKRIYRFILGKDNEAPRNIPIEQIAEEYANKYGLAVIVGVSQVENDMYAIYTKSQGNNQTRWPPKGFEQAHPSKLSRILHKIPFVKKA